MKKFISVILVLFAIAGVLSVRVPDPQAQTATATPTAPEEPTIIDPPALPTATPEGTPRVVLQAIDGVGHQEVRFEHYIVREYSDRSWYIYLERSGECDIELWFDEAPRKVLKCDAPTLTPTTTP